MPAVLVTTFLLWIPNWSIDSRAAEPSDISPERASAGLQRAVEFYRTTVSSHGGYLWRYASDFTEREGELPASSTTVWVQPPGTPSVGLAYLSVYELTGDDYYLDAVRETALALVAGQLESGGWDYRIEFASPEREKYAYRAQSSARNQRARNVTTLDDNTTQTALRFLMRADRALAFAESSIHESVKFALRSLLAAQYPNGAWPQRFTDPPNREEFPVRPASYPADWPREYPKVDYRNFYTFNDNTIVDMIELMFLAAAVYDDEQFSAAGKRAGDFILLSQMPEPQPGWAQQYNTQMHPAWARKFEPAAITGAESQRVMETLLRLFELTRDVKYLQPLPRALAYFRHSRLENGQLARFYELRTNRPLYFTKDYQLTYSDANLPTHYGFKSNSRLDSIAARYEQLAATVDLKGVPVEVLGSHQGPAMSLKLEARAAELVTALDARGAWVEPAYYRARSNMPKGMPSLSSATFAKNIVTLAEYIAAYSRQND